jgi:hypothetical protein
MNRQSLTADVGGMNADQVVSVLRASVSFDETPDVSEPEPSAHFVDGSGHLSHDWLARFLAG